MLNLGLGLNIYNNGGLGTPPVNTVAPAITGALEVGEVLTCSDGTWTGTEPITYVFQWKRGVTNIGTDSANYTAVYADIDQNITCTVTATNTLGNASQVSNTVTVVLNPILDPDNASVLVDLRAISNDDFVLAGTDVATWYNRGVIGLDATEPTNRPVFDLANKKVVFTAANSDQLKFESPVTMNCNEGWSLLVGFKQTGNDTYLIGSSDTSGFYIFPRNANISVGFNAVTSRLFTYTTWGITKKTGRAILELTHNGAVANSITARMNNANPYTSVEAGTLLLDRTYFDLIGDRVGGANWNSEVAFVFFQNKPFTADERAAKYAELSANYIPE